MVALYTVSGVYNTFTLILVTLSLVFSIFTLRIYYHHEPVPRWVHVVSDCMTSYQCTLTNIACVFAQ